MSRATSRAHNVRRNPRVPPPTTAPQISGFQWKAPFEKGMETKSFETKKNTFENTFNPFVTETKKQMESSVPNMQNPFQYPWTSQTRIPYW